MDESHLIQCTIQCGECGCIDDYVLDEDVTFEVGLHGGPRMWFTCYMCERIQEVEL